MNSGLKRFIRQKRQWTEPLDPEDIQKGFRGWHGSKYLPHFDAPGVEQFITYRLGDSLPRECRGEWEAFLHLEDDLERQRKIQMYLDRGRGACHLRKPKVADLVQENLRHSDGRRYRLCAWVVMPNHVHALAEIWQTPMEKLLHSWKSYTAKQANTLLGQTGMFWAEDYFDRFIRDAAHFARVVRYIEHNPVKAGLVRSPEEWPWSSAYYRLHNRSQ